MESKIKILSTDVADKIAAGEVVERPSSVVKELVENAIDAGANKITVEIKNGGVKLIRVADNGKGIPSEQVETAFLRHATSKLSSADDLFRIMTMGFRGEALSSICAVAKVSLITKTADAEVGTHYTIDHGIIGTKDEIACAQGTIMVIEDLFANVPARMKFLKRDSTEAGYVSDLMIRLALSKPNIAFDYICDGKQVFNTSGDGDIKNVILKVYGLKFAKNIIGVDYSEDGVRVSGVIGKPEISFGNRTKQTLFVNGRYVKNHVVAKVAEEAFRNAIMVGKFPFFVLEINMPAQLVDVNVHPAKTEVKFANEKQIYDIVFHAMKNAMYNNVHRPKSEHTDITANKNNNTDFVTNGYIKSPDNTQKLSSSRKSNIVQVSDPVSAVSPKMVNEFIDRTVPKMDNNMFVRNEDVNNDKKDLKDIKFEDIIDNHVENGSMEKDITIDTSHQIESNNELEYDTPNHSFEQTEFAQNNSNNIKEQKLNVRGDSSVFFTDYRIIGQVFSTYVIVTQGDSMYMIDQHAAHERVRFEELKKSYLAGERMSQMLISPIVVYLTHVEFDTVITNLSEFEKFGFVIEEFGTNTIIVNETPVMTSDDEIKSLLIEIIDALVDNIKHPIANFEEKALDMISCKYAIKANDSLSLQEMTGVVNHVNELYAQGINTCPHGRPIIVENTKKEIEKTFKRIV